MKKVLSKKKKKHDNESDEIRPHYNFSGGVRGKYAGRLRENGYTIRVIHDDGTITETRVPGERVIEIEPDVWAHFPTSQAVNHALRTLISLVSVKNPAKKRRSAGKQASPTGD